MKKKKLIRIAAIALILLGLSLASNRSIYWFFYFDGPYYGRVVDAETGVPLEGAAVAGIWKFEHLYFKSIYTFANAKETTTGRDGKFKLPLTFAFTLYPISLLGKMELLVFKPGYDSHPPAIRRKTNKPEWVAYISESGVYKLGRHVDCKAGMECIVELNKAISFEEERDVYGKIGFGYIPIDQRYKLKNIINSVNKEGFKFNADRIPANRRELNN